MRTLPRRLGLSIAILLLISALSLINDEARAQDTAAEPRVGYSGYPVPRFVALKADLVNGRASPGLEPVVIYRRKGLPVKVIAETPDNTWRRVEDHMGRRVWIRPIMLVQNKHAITTTPAVLYAEPSLDAFARARLEKGVMAKLETCEEDWCRIKTRLYRGWLPKTELWGVL